MAETAAQTHWYAIQTYSGHENKVQRLIERRIEEEPGEGDAQEIREVLVPTQEVTEIRKGKRVMVTKRLYPGYVLVEMVLNERTQYVINNIQGVINSTSIDTLSPGITISTPSGNCTAPVTSVVRK